MTTRRIQNLKESMKSEGIDCMAIIPGNSFLYFTGMRVLLHERPMIIMINSEGKNAFLLPGLELPSASAVLDDKDYDYYTYTDEEGYWKALETLCKDFELDGKTIAMEYQGMRVFEFDLLRQGAPNASFQDGEHLIEDLRMIKDDQEIAYLKKAAEITDLALDEAIKCIKPGVRELEVLNEMIIQLLRFGSQEPLKTQIVVSGPRSAFPHSKASERTIESGDLVMIDTGATYNGYPCDLTRTFAVQHVDDEMAKIYEIVKSANAAVMAVKHQGFTAHDVDKAARDVIEAQGYGQYFIHRTGHGLGIGGHEAPGIVQGNPLVLKEGMTFSNEPGIYIQGKGGVRIEDNVVVVPGGLEYLTHYPRELKVLE